MIERKRGNFVLFKADFADVCGQYVEKSNAEQDKICRLQPIDGNFNRLLATRRFIDAIAQRFELVRALRITFFLLFVHAVVWAKPVRYRCMWREDPATSMVIGWDQVSGNNPILYYGPQYLGKDVKKYPFSAKPSATNTEKGMNNHFVRLQNLKPNTEYYFLIQDSEGIHHNLSFKTAPDSPTRLSIVSGGDSRNNQEARRSANIIVGKLHPHMVLFNGDMTDEDTEAEWREWLNDWQLTTTSSGRLTPVVVSMGNHETSPNTMTGLFDVPNAQAYYSLQFAGGLLHLITLNTMIPASGTQKSWLEQELRTSKAQWKMAQYHHAMRPHTAKKEEKNLLYSHWASLFHTYGVQLASESDSHVTKWTYPIRPSNETGSAEGFIRDDAHGTVYIGEGCWGAPLRPNDDDKPWTRSSGSFNQFHWIFVSKDKIDIRTIKTDGGDRVQEVKEPNIFEPPLGLVIWNPQQGGAVLTIPARAPGAKAAEEPKSPPVTKSGAGAATAVAEKPVTTAPAEQKTTPKPPAANDWSTLPLAIPSNNLLVVTTTFNEAEGKAEAMLVDKSNKVLRTWAMPPLGSGAQTLRLPVAGLPAEEYLLVVKGSKGLIGRYRVKL